MSNDKLANDKAKFMRNFCSDCGKRTPAGSIHTCAPAYAVEQADAQGKVDEDILSDLATTAFIKWQEKEGAKSVDQCKSFCAGYMYGSLDRPSPTQQAIENIPDATKMVNAARRYEIMRKLNVPQFKELYRRNIAGEGRFDDLVDQLGRQTIDAGKV